MGCDMIGGEKKAKIREAYQYEYDSVCGYQPYATGRFASDHTLPKAEADRSKRNRAWSATFAVKSCLVSCSGWFPLTAFSRAASH